MTRVLITGGAGFIGSHLTETLLESGHEVLVLDDMSTGSVENILPFRRNPRFRVLIDSVTNGPVLSDAVHWADVVYHLAAAVGVQLVVQDPVRTVETNIAGAEVVLRAAVRELKRVLLASTSEVYGKSTAVPFKEDADLVLGPTTRARWAYAASKAIDEFLGIAYWRQYRLPVTIVRLFNTIGPRQTGAYGMVAPRFVRAALKGEPLLVYGDGKQSRCFTDVRDVVRALAELADCEASYGEIYNIGTQNEISIEDLARKVIALTGSASAIRYLTYDEAYTAGFEDMRRRVPDTTKLQQAIGYAPQYSFEETLEAIIAYQRDVLGTGSPTRAG